MKTTRNLATLILFLITLIFFCSCSNNLSRDKAKELIIKHFQYPIVVTNRFPVGNINTGVRDWGNEKSGQNASWLTPWKKLENEGVITAKFKKMGGLFNSQDIYEVIITENGKKYMVGNIMSEQLTMYSPITQYANVKIGEWNFNEITGIKYDEGKKNATVEFSIKAINITPFNDFNWGDYNRGLFEGKIENKEVTFSKYDDGWRINK